VRLDEFIAKGELKMAMHFARVWREAAIKKEQENLVEVYDYYIEYIEPRIQH
jgi:hypothetical protein